MNVLNVLAFVSLLVSLGTGIYFVSRKIAGWLAVFMMMAVTFAVIAVSMRVKTLLVISGYIALQVIVCALCFVHEATMPGKSSRKTRKRKHDDDDEDEYISTAPTMTVRQIVSEYTRNPQEAEERYTDSPMNVIGLITRITNGGTYSHVELDEKFICICPQGSVRNLKPLQKVCITGILRGKYLLDDCLMVKHPV